MAKDDSVRAVVYHGAGREAFASGTDISELKAHCKDTATALRYNAQTSAAYTAIRECPKPAVAMVSGFCMGGAMTVAVACDLRFAAKGSKFGIPAARLSTIYAPTRSASSWTSWAAAPSSPWAMWAPSVHRPRATWSAAWTSTGSSGRGAGAARSSSCSRTSSSPPIVADTGGLFRGLASRRDGKPRAPEYAKVLTSASLVIVLTGLRHRGLLRPSAGRTAAGRAAGPGDGAAGACC
ncbi:MAG: hypothetical protein DMD99_09570 [Candidatus Rokuibacteriota bacterium]|nr:MAG: hypothetical protein DMD99_09570 [Candidatus Rokubacteria bacterium]